MTSIDTRVSALKGKKGLQDVLDEFGAFRSHRIDDYFSEIEKAKDNNQAILYVSNARIIFIEEIGNFRKVDAITALSMLGIYGEHISISGKGYACIKCPITPKEKKSNPHVPLEDFYEYPLIVTKTQNPPLLANDCKTLNELYYALIGF